MERGLSSHKLGNLGENLSHDDPDHSEGKHSTEEVQNREDGEDIDLISLVHVSHYTILSTNCKPFLRVFLKFLCA